MQFDLIGAGNVEGLALRVSDLCREIHAPLAVGVALGPGGVFREFYGDVLSRIRPSPHGNRLVTLEHSVIGEDRGERYLGLR